MSARHLAFILTLASLAARPAIASAGPIAPAVAITRMAPPARAAAPGELARDAARYAAREARARQQKNFRGGGSIVIGASVGTVLVVLLIVLILL